MERYTPFRPRRGERSTTQSFTPQQQMNGVCIYLEERGIRQAERQHSIIKKYAEYRRWKLCQERPIVDACLRIQQEFRPFLKWFQRHHDPNNKDIQHG